MQLARKILLNEKEAAAILGVSPRKLQLWRHDRTGGPPFVKMDDTPRAGVRYDEADLFAWIDGRKVRRDASI